MKKSTQYKHEVVSIWRGLETMPKQTVGHDAMLEPTVSSQAIQLMQVRNMDAEWWARWWWWYSSADRDINCSFLNYKNNEIFIFYNTVGPPLKKWARRCWSTSVPANIYPRPMSAFFICSNDLGRFYKVSDSQVVAVGRRPIIMLHVSSAGGGRQSASWEE